MRGVAGRDWSEGSDSSIEETKLCVCGGGGGGGEGGRRDRWVYEGNPWENCVCVCFVGKGERCVCEGEGREMCVRGKGEGCV